MFVQESLELRWFLTRGEADSVAGLFDGVAVENEGKQRIDRYYVDPARLDIGTKERVEADKPPKFEVKYRTGVIHGFEVAPGVVGDLERWQKLSIPLNGNALDPDHRWVADTEKKRRLRKFEFDGDSVTEVSPTARPAAGCGLEFTEVTARVAGRPSVEVVTLGVEAFGAAGDLLRALTAVVNDVVSGAVVLTGAASASYPAWLGNEMQRVLGER
ncbi:MAG: hypothetical protein JJ863_17745 [Deltaproteobacteria bacterium]|nr:hypothetical protein [Deltaproteobacteria bacterium]